MSLPNYLAKIKSAGVYRYVFDKSDIPEPVRDSIRLVVGYSEKGPFNTPVYIEDSTDFIRTFGNISRRMERKGIFFHRMALQCLEAGPIVCLNLKPFNEVAGKAEKADIYAFNASDIKVNITGPITPSIAPGTYNFNTTDPDAPVDPDNQDASASTSPGIILNLNYGDSANTVIMAPGPGSMLVTDDAVRETLNFYRDEENGTGFVLTNDQYQAIIDEFVNLTDGAGVGTVGQAREAFEQAIILPSITNNETGEPDPEAEVSQELLDQENQVIDTLAGKAKPNDGKPTNTDEVLYYTLNGGEETPYSKGIDLNPALYSSHQAIVVAYVKNSKGELVTPEYTFTYVDSEESTLPKAVGFVTKDLKGSLINLWEAGLYFDKSVLDVLEFKIPKNNNASKAGEDEIIPDEPEDPRILPTLEIYNGSKFVKEFDFNKTPASVSEPRPNVSDSCVQVLTAGEVRNEFPTSASETTITLAAHFTMAGLADGPDNVIRLQLTPPDGSATPGTKGPVSTTTVNIVVPESKVETGHQNMHAVGAQAYIADTDDGKLKLDTIYDTNRFWKVDAERIHEIKAIDNGLGVADKDYMRIVHTGSEDDSCTVFIRPYVPTNWNVKISDWYASEVVDEMPPYLEPIKDHYLSEFFIEIYVFKGDLRREGLYMDTGTLGSYKPFAEEGEDAWQPFCIIEHTDDGDKLMTNPAFKNAYNEIDDALEAMSEATTSNFINRYVGITFPSFKDGAGNFIDIASVFNRDHQEHKMLMGLNEALLDDAYDLDLNGDDVYNDGSAPKIHDKDAVDVPGFIHALCSPIVGYPTAHQLEKLDDEVRFDPAGKSIQGLYIRGYKYNSISRADRDEDLQKKVMKVLNYKGIFEALTNNIDIDYKYIVDTFQTYPGTAMKSQLSYIAQKKFNCLAILNFPTIRSILDFCGWKNYKGGFDMKAILKKGNDGAVTMPSEVQGASWSAFYTQLQMTDGAVKFTVPSAALVSNLFMEKRAKRLPYYIVAGPNYGRITDTGVVGPDYNYSRADLDILEPFGVNTIIHIPRQGIVINGNQTAKQTPVTSLSKVHVRELVTFLQDELERMLLGYQWELNTATLRDMVRSKAEVILGLCLANGGIYDFKITCDETNNTPEVINNSMLVLDVDIIAAKGTEKIVQTLTLHRIGTNLQIV